MNATRRSVSAFILALLGTVVLGAAAMLSSAATMAETTALIMGGSGTPNPADVPGYVPNVANYYIYPNSSCQPEDPCVLVSVITPEEAWPLYGGLTALTWKDSILQGVDIYDQAVRSELSNDVTCSGPNPTCRKVMFGYSQSGAILAIEKRALADDPTINEELLEIVVIGNPSRPNGGLNARLPITVPIIEFPFGPPMPTDTDITTTDIAFKWDIIADAPLHVLSPLAMANAIIGGPGFGIIHGTYPNPIGEPATGLIGGYTQAEWQDMMDNPEDYPDIITIEEFGDTTYMTVTPKVLPLVVPLHNAGLTPLADLIEPALRVIIETNGYDRSLSYGEPTRFRLTPAFKPVELARGLAVAIPEGIDAFRDDLGVTSTPAPSAPAVSPLSAARAVETSAVSTPVTTSDPQPEPAATNTDPATDNKADEPTTARDTPSSTKANTPAAKPDRPKPLRRVVSELQKTTERIASTLKRDKPETADAEANEAGASTGDASSTGDVSSDDASAKDAA